MIDPIELMKAYALNNKNYKKWREMHTQMFGTLFSDAFAEDEIGQIHLTATLINISQRNFSEAMVKLKILESICMNEYDRAVVDYFIGLDHELMEDYEGMHTYYERVKESGVTLTFPGAFHPYYRTAKFAQRDSECGKALRYYEKALSFLNLSDLDQQGKVLAALILYDVATVCLYMHRYDLCEHYIQLSETLSPEKNSQRDYVKTILLAVQGKREACDGLMKGMNPFFRANLQPMVTAIFSGTDPHYCVVPQDRSGHGAFWERICSLRDRIESGNTGSLEECISDALTETMAFMERRLSCRVMASEGYITVLCKNYNVKSLMNEYQALFSCKPQALSDWIFISVAEYE